MIRLLLYILAFLLIAQAAHASPIVADLSNYKISMDAGFNGTRIFIFGARNDYGDVVVVIRGENKNFIVRKKEEFLGMWINRDRMKFNDVPNFYAIATSKPLGEIDELALFARLGIGEKSIMQAPTDLSKIAKFNDFEAAFLDYQHERKLYSEKPEELTFMQETLFKTTINFSDNIPPGQYTAEIYLISDGELMGMQSTPITVVKSGIDAFIFDFAHNSPALYGITAIAMALAAGWAASQMFGNKA